MGDKACKKLVKVDNWGMFFLQRLQQHFSRDEFCDFTLQFDNGEKVKAHRLVLDVCTEYFQILQKQGLFVGNCIHMPEDMLPDVVIPVVNFMYTGRLEFRADIQERLYATAQKMKMTVLTKLLDAQSLNTQQQQLKSQQAAKFNVNRVSPKKLPPGTFTNLQGKKVSPRIVDPNLPVTLPGRKLPIWTRRCIPNHSYTSTSIAHFDQPIRIITSPAVTEPPRPTRFEWPDDADDQSPSMLTATFEDISYESKPLMQLKQTKPNLLTKEKAPAAPVPTEKKATFEDVYRTGAVGMAKRPATDPVSPDAAKKAKTMDLQAVTEYVREAQVRSHLVEKDDSDEDVDNDLAAAEMNDDEEDEDEEDQRYEKLLQPHKSILKTSSSADDESPTNKRVRFSVDGASTADEKENAVKVPEPRPLPTRALSNITSASTPTATNHAKIISEVLKKYPHLVKNNKNIRLKIMQRGTSSQVAIERDATNRPVKSKVSYVVLKSEMTGGKAKPMAAMGSNYGGLTQLPRGSVQLQPGSGAENTTGPWLCHSCGTNEEPVDFETYYLYRHHLQDVHMEKIDARICEHCGHRASKRNLLLYHLYTKHNVTPPRNCQFPKCDQCDYVALSESLLIKHRNNHLNVNRDYVCRVCNAGFKSNGALQGHMQTNLHSGPSKKNYECPHCAKPFVRNINLKAHIRMSHKDLVQPFDKDELDDMEFDENELAEEEGEMLGEDGEGEGMMEVPVLEMMNETTSGMTILAEAPASLEPSSEAEGLSHVASGIATSLGLTDGQQTVILLDNNQEYILHTTEVVGDEYNDVDSTLVQEGSGYIVPDMLEAEDVVQTEEEEEEEEDDDGALGSYESESTDNVIQNSGEVMLVLTDHCYAEDKDENQLQENHAQNTIHLQTNDLGGLDFVHSENVANDDDEGQVIVEHGKSSKIVPDNKFKQSIVIDPPPPMALFTSIMKMQSPADENPAPVEKPTMEMSHLLDDWDEECTQEADDAQGSMVNAQGALPTRDEMYIMPSAPVREGAFFSQQELDTTVGEEEISRDAVSESQMPEEGITNEFLVSNHFDNEKDNFLPTERNEGEQKLTDYSADSPPTLAHSLGEIENQHLPAKAVPEDTLLMEQAVESNTLGLTTSASFSEATNYSVPFRGEVDQIEESSEVDLTATTQLSTLDMEEAEYSQDIVDEMQKLSGELAEGVENSHNMELSDEIETNEKEAATSSLEVKTMQGGNDELASFTKVAENDLIPNSEPSEETEKYAVPNQAVSLPDAAESNVEFSTLQADQPSTD